MWICCSSAAGAAEREGDRPSHPPARRRHDVLCGNIKCILRTDRNVIAHHKCFHPLTRNKTHVRSQKAVFTLTNGACCCLAVKDLPAPPKAFLCQGNKHQPKWFYDFMKVFSSLSFSVVWFFFFLVAHAWNKKSSSLEPVGPDTASFAEVLISLKPGFI